MSPSILLHNICPLHQLPNSIPPPIQTWINISTPLPPPFLWTHLKSRDELVNRFKSSTAKDLKICFSLWLKISGLKCSFILALPCLLVSAASKWNPKWGLSAAGLNGTAVIVVAGAKRSEPKLGLKAKEVICLKTDPISTRPVWNCRPHSYGD